MFLSRLWCRRSLLQTWNPHLSNNGEYASRCSLVSGFDRPVYWSAAATHALAEAITLFGRHLFPSLSHAVAPERGAPPGVAMKAAKEQLGEQQQAQCLPESERAQTEDLWHQSIPQFHDHEAHGSDSDE